MGAPLSWLTWSNQKDHKEPPHRPPGKDYNPCSDSQHFFVGKFNLTQLDILGFDILTDQATQQMVSGTEIKSFIHKALLEVSQETGHK